MKNFTTYEDFLPELKANRTLVVTTDYSRPDTDTPFLNRVVLNRLKSEGVVKSTSLGVGRHKVEFIR